MRTFESYRTTRSRLSRRPLRWLRVLTVPVVAAALISGAFAAGTASAATASTTQRTAISKPALRIQPQSVLKWEYYSSKTTCELEGSYMLGEVMGGQIVIGYYCLETGSPAPIGPWALYLELEPLSCAGVRAPAADPSMSVKMRPDGIAC